MRRRPQTRVQSMLASMAASLARGPGIGHQKRDLDELGIELSEPQFPPLENGLDEHPAPRAVLQVQGDCPRERVTYLRAQTRWFPFSSTPSFLL